MFDTDESLAAHELSPTRKWRIFFAYFLFFVKRKYEFSFTKSIENTKDYLIYNTVAMLQNKNTFAQGIEYEEGGAFDWSWSKVGYAAKGNVARYAVKGLMMYATKNQALSEGVTAAFMSGYSTRGNAWEFKWDYKNTTEHLTAGLATGLSTWVSSAGENSFSGEAGETSIGAGIGNSNNSPSVPNVIFNDLIAGTPMMGDLTSGAIYSSLMTGMYHATGGKGFKNNYYDYDWNSLVFDHKDIGNALGNMLVDGLKLKKYGDAATDWTLGLASDIGESMWNLVTGDGWNTDAELDSQRIQSDVAAAEASGQKLDEDSMRNKLQEQQIAIAGEIEDARVAYGHGDSDPRSNRNSTYEEMAREYFEDSNGLASDFDNDPFANMLAANKGMGYSRNSKYKDKGHHVFSTDRMIDNLDAVLLNDQERRDMAELSKRNQQPSIVDFVKNIQIKNGVLYHRIYGETMSEDLLTEYLYLLKKDTAYTKLIQNKFSGHNAKTSDKVGERILTYSEGDENFEFRKRYYELIINEKITSESVGKIPIVIAEELKGANVKCSNKYEVNLENGKSIIMSDTYDDRVTSIILKNGKLTITEYFRSNIDPSWEYPSVHSFENLPVGTSDLWAIKGWHRGYEGLNIFNLDSVNKLEIEDRTKFMQKFLNRINSTGNKRLTYAEIRNDYNGVFRAYLPDVTGGRQFNVNDHKGGYGATYSQACSTKLTVDYNPYISSFKSNQVMKYYYRRPYFRMNLKEYKAYLKRKNNIYNIQRGN